jgi:hypothetical protein
MPSEAIVANQDRSAAGGDVGGNDSGDSVDVEAIFQSIGEVPYAWRIDSDELRWGPNAGTVLAIADPATIASGRSFAQLIDPKSGPTRFDAVMRSAAPDEGVGVPYQVEYALRARRIRRSSSGSRIPAAGSLARTASRCAPTASSASSTSATSAKRGSLISRVSTR